LVDEETDDAADGTTDGWALAFSAHGSLIALQLTADCCALPPHQRMMIQTAQPPEPER
jgi:hypothetical protein